MLARAWAGTTETGVPVTLYVVAVQVPDGFITPEFLDAVAAAGLNSIPKGQPS